MATSIVLCTDICIGLWQPIGMFMEFFLCITLIGPAEEVELHVVSKHPGLTDCKNAAANIQDEMPFELHCMVFQSPDHPM